MSYISSQLKTSLIKCVKTRLGLHFHEDRWSDLERGMSAAAQELGFRDIPSCIKWIESANLSKNALEILANHLTVGETYFFREKRSLEVLEGKILPELIHSRMGNERCLRIWNTACSTGEEPYTVAIMLSGMIPDINGWNITLLATDVSTRSLRKAMGGEYTEWSFRDNPPEIKGKYFTRTKQGRYKILPKYKKMVTFSYLNFAEDVYPSFLNNTNAMDVILCRNVLMYFDQDMARIVIEKLCRSIVEGGYLIVSVIEAAIINHPCLVPIHIPGVPIYRKDSSESKKANDIARQWFDSGFQYSETEDTYSCQSAFVRPDDQNKSLGEEGERAWVVDPEEEQKIDLNEPGEKVKFDVSNRDKNDINHRSVSVETDIVSEVYKEALALYEQGSYAEVVNKIRYLDSQGYCDSKSLALLASAYADQGQLAEASEWCKKAITVDRLNTYCYYLLATIQEEQNQITEAIRSLRQALYIDNNFILAHFKLGNLTKKEGNLSESRKHFDNTIQLLTTLDKEDVLPESGGITAGRLLVICKEMLATI